MRTRSLVIATAPLTTVYAAGLRVSEVAQPPSQFQHRPSASHCHYPHSAKPPAASFNPASMRSHSRPYNGPVLTTRPHRTLKLHDSRSHIPPAPPPCLS